MTDLSAPTTDLRQRFTDRLNADGSMVSKDYLGTASWQMTVRTNRYNLEDALESASLLESAWKDPEVRASTSPVPLDYSNDGGSTWYRIYGKPGQFTGAVPDVLTKLGVATVDLEFIQTDPRHYTAAEDMTTIYTAAASVGGIMSPIVSPITTVASGAPKSGYVDNTGNLPAPLTVTFYGPSTNPKILTEGKTVVEYKGTLAYDQTVTIDPLQGSVSLNNGVSVAGRLGRMTRLSRLTVPSGRSSWTYSATDLTGSSKAELRWRGAHTAQQA